ncbi:MAG: bifunctional chorismate mutase/prephenate dehydrogenase [Planctomycetota bacterium]|jgi:prephenate dehydrogenase/chorismate mutase/prephenate dehydrogenase
MAHDLADLDRELGRLLAERIRILAEAGDSGAPGGDAAVPEGIPVPLWHGIVVGTAAAAADARPKELADAAPRNVVIVGGRGIMGSFMAARLEAYGHKVSGTGRAGWGGELEPLLKEADLVIVSVPIDRVEEIVRRAAAHMRPDAALADVTSVKRGPCAAMMDEHPGPVLGLHPMFGPGPTTFLSQIVVVCPGRGEDEYAWLIDLMEADGARLVRSTPEEHDRMMVAVQAARHFATVAMGVFLAGEGVDVARSLDFASPVYRLEIDMLGRLFAQDAWLYVDIMMATEERKAAITRLAETYTRLAEVVAAGDRDGLMAEFDSVKATLGPEAARALEESNRVIEAFAGILASR